ncbi:glucokinase [Filimonas lacunae]|uniref:Glucokinase n=2 Tax=Filimonas lacunae TaxID=477680 RepID=A0A173MQJ5_9BACT|nr:glucokinase [Filimonas lacunae]SIS75866.1 glucokinase [Filimonas lacunae]
MQRVLAADVGGTKVNMALCYVTDEKIEIIHSVKYASQQYASFTDIIKAFLAEEKVEQPDKIGIGVAGPVIDNTVEFTNLNWVVSAKEIAEVAGVPVEHVALINDLEATAYGLPCLSDDDILTIHAGEPGHSGNAAIIAPGTGLGEAGLFYDSNGYHPFATEGGHCEFAPRTEMEAQLFSYLKVKHRRVSWEHVVAGPGIYRLYYFLRDVLKREEPEWLKKEIEEKGDPSAVISEAGLQKRAPICEEVMQLFVQQLAREASSLVLKMKATGGLFFGGGIPPKILPLLKDPNFYETFIDCGRMQELVAKVPVKIILNDKSALYGAAYYGAYGL